VNGRVFISTGEASGELAAVELAAAMSALAPGLVFEGIGGRRMEQSGFRLRWDTRGWASLGPVEALGKIPKLLAVVLITAAELRARPPDLVVLVDFGAFNLRMARQLRRTGYRGPICYYFPPAAWLDDPRRARMVVQAASAVTPFAHQRDFYASLGLPIAYFGHPLVSTIAPRPVRARPSAAGGRIAILPGSRGGELARHGRLLLEAARLLAVRRPQAEFVLGAADAEAENVLREMSAGLCELRVTIVRGARAALSEADAAWIASGTAVLEAALIGVPSVAMYVVSKAQEQMARRLVARTRLAHVTVPNLVLGAAVIPELLQEGATQTTLVEALEGVLERPQEQLTRFAELRAALGPPDALERTAAFAVELAESVRS
jgi:lipid-A-disaccharide synthase